MDLELWKLFVQVSELGSLSKAATCLNRPQPVISRHINSLESLCGSPLFYRTGRGVALTEVGQEVLPRVRALIEEADQILLDTRARSGVPVGRVSLGLLPSIRIADELVRRITKSYPQISLHIAEASGGHIGEQVAVGRLDLGLVLRDPVMLPPAENALLRLPMCLVGPPGNALTKAGAVALEAVAGLPLIMATTRSSMRVFVGNAARKAGVPLTFGTEVDSPATQRVLVAAGLGWTITTRSSVRVEVESGLLSAADIVDPALDMMLVLMQSSQRPGTLAIRKVAQVVTDLIRKFPEHYASDVMPAYLPVGRRVVQD